MKGSFIPAVDKDQVIIIWHNNYYDGVLNGVCYYHGRKHYFSCLNDIYIGRNGYRIYLLYYLTDDEIKDITYRHDKFVEYVGFHSDHRLDTQETYHDIEHKLIEYEETFWELDLPKYEPKDDNIIGSFMQ